MAGSPPNLHTMNSRSACIQGVLNVKVKVKAHVIRALLCWQENRFFSHANHRIKASSLQSNIFSISVYNVRQVEAPLRAKSAIYDFLVVGVITFHRRHRQTDGQTDNRQTDKQATAD